MTTYTSTLPDNLMQWVKKQAKTKGLRLNAIFEQALLQYKHDLRKQELAESFQAAKNDTEILGLTEFHDFSL